MEKRVPSLCTGTYPETPVLIIVIVMHQGFYIRVSGTFKALGLLGC